ncbi:MAG: imidazole glycerol phosphate synthase subunit HisH [Arcobacter sp.]|nr:MAG: imidazole glycerol phosphate synthase subunit HisH [Arcobacter sp.]
MAVKVGIINYHMGNIQSVVNALTFLGHIPLVSSDPNKLKDADAYILPGVGAFAQAMKNLEHEALIEFLNEEVLFKKKPILGICLGMQLMTNYSLELGEHKGFGWIDAQVLPIPISSHLRVPHVGWNNLEIYEKEPLFSRLNKTSHFYFDHSFYVYSNDKSIITATCNHGVEMCVSFRKDNIFATQFHPEKSQTSGLKLLRNFLDYCEASLW